jgi:glutamyl-tRNA synthetase/glutamyl-Q tRNA(Asp) synthetase
LVDAKVLLRVEDHDRQRCRSEYEASIFEDLAWLGFEPYNKIAAKSEFRQSDNGAIYEAALARLAEAGLVYRCACSRKDLAAENERRYPGRCRELNVPPELPHSLRLLFEPGKESFYDALTGEQWQEPFSQCGDLVLRDRNKQWTYQFAVTVDDLRHGVNLIIRGADLLASTGRQLRTARLLGQTHAPIYAHHPLIVDGDGQKLSKSDGAAAIRELRGQGIDAESVLGMAAYRAGLTATRERIRAANSAAVVQAAHPGLANSIKAASP